MASLKVVIKSPNQIIEDFEILCDPTWTVGQLKDRLHESYPMQPTRSQQRIIYSGRLLLDHLVLKDVLTSCLDKHTIHLVCPNSMLSNEGRASSSNADQQNRQSPNDLQSSVENVLPTMAQHGDMLRRRFLNAPMSQFPMSPLYPPGAPVPSLGAASMSSPYVAYQLAAAHQTYAQLVAHAMAQSRGTLQNPQQPPQPTPQPPAANRMEHPYANARLNGAANEDPGGLLHFVYILTRVLLLCTVLYFYSTPRKVLIVLSLGFLFSIYLAFKKNHRSDQQNVGGEQRPPNGRVNNRNNQTRHEEDNSDGSQDQSSTEGNNASPQPGPAVTFSILTLIKTFFTSLLPEQPLPIQT